MLRTLILSLLIAFAFPVLSLPATGDSAPSPLFRDPNYDGAADPEIVWNTHAKEWWIFYTGRRATLPDEMTYAGNPIGVAASRDGQTWRHLGYCQFDGKGGRADSDDTYWAPGIIRDGDTYHMFVTFKKGRPRPWTGKSFIVHYQAPARNLLNGWKKVKSQTLPDGVIDAGLLKLGREWKLWYKHKGKVPLVVSKDLLDWKKRGLIPGDVNEERGIEAPFVFRWKGAYWMLTDPHNGIQVYRSEHTESWKKTGTILLAPGSRPLDNSRGRHASAAVVDGRAFVFYHVEPNRDYINKKDPNEKTPGEKICVLQVAEIEWDGEKIICDRNRAVRFPFGFASGQQ